MNENDTFKHDDTFTINVTETDSYKVGDYNISDINSNSCSTITLDLSDNITYSVPTISDNFLDIDVVDAMCKEYPALAKSWDTFIALYNLVKDDYKGEIEDDDIPF